MAVEQALLALVGAADTGAYQINQSLRFDGSAYLNRTPASAGNRRTSTFSCWFKWVSTGGEGVFLWASGRTKLAIDGGGSDEVSLDDYDGSYNIRKITSQSLRDPSAWYHLMVVMDTTNATAEDRQRLYLNGQRITAFSTSTNPSQNFDTEWNNNVEHRIGADNNPFYFRGYMAECYMVDGTALTPSSFGETDTITGAWIPKKYSGSYGTNGFYLKFDPSATNGIGHDHSGNGNNFTATGFSTSGTGTDVMSDTPTNNYPTGNPLASNNPSSVSEGNLKFVGDPANIAANGMHTTMGMSSGKWYFEVDINVAGGARTVGILPADAFAKSGKTTTTNYDTYYNNGALSYDGFGGNKIEGFGSSVTSTAYGNSWTTNDVVGVAFDADNGKLFFAKNNTWQNSGDPVAGTNAAFTGISGTYVVHSGGAQGFTATFNFGQRAFAYTPPTGFKALNTANLPEPTIKKGSKYFDTKLYTANNQTAQTITGLGFSPDLLWFKPRSRAEHHYLYDRVRGAGNRVSSSQTIAEITGDNSLTAFTSDGFSLGTDGAGIVNYGTDSMVAWAWDANGAGSSNTAGSITSTVSANATAGFSIVTYTSPNNAADQTVGHGLGVKPSLIIVKNRDLTYNWDIYHASLGYNASLIFTSAGTRSGAFGAEPTSTVFTTKTGYTHNSTNTYVAYCFSEVAGYSKFGRYTGNGSTDGPFVFCGFRPAFIMIKRTDTTGNWTIHDNRRLGYNGSSASKELYPNLSNSEGTDNMDQLSNGFKLRDTYSDVNASGGTYIFAAFSETAFKFANAR